MYYFERNWNKLTVRKKRAPIKLATSGTVPGIISAWKLLLWDWYPNKYDAYISWQIFVIWRMSMFGCTLDNDKSPPMPVVFKEACEWCGWRSSLGLGLWLLLQWRLYDFRWHFLSLNSLTVDIFPPKNDIAIVVSCLTFLSFILCSCSVFIYSLIATVLKHRLISPWLLPMYACTIWGKRGPSLMKLAIRLSHTWKQRSWFLSQF